MHELRPDVGRAGETEVERFGHGRDDIAGRGERGEWDERNSIGKTVGALARGVNSQAGLADAARAKQREQPASQVGQQLAELGQLPLAADEGSGVDGQLPGGARLGAAA